MDKSPLLPKLLRSGAQLMSKLGQSSFIDKNKKSVKVWLKRYNTTKDKKPLMSAHHRKELVVIYKEDTEFMEDYWGKKLDRWRS